MSKKELKHTCAQNQDKEVEIHCEKINREEWGWVLSLWQFANEFDIEDGYQGEEGSTMCYHHLLIKHCPFCGEDLEKIEQSTWTYNKTS